MAFVRHAAVWLAVAITGGLFLSRLADSLAHRLAGIFQMIHEMTSTGREQYAAGLRVRRERRMAWPQPAPGAGGGT